MVSEVVVVVRHVETTKVVFGFDAVGGVGAGMIVSIAVIIIVIDVRD